MKDIDLKSLIIDVLLTSTIILSVGGVAGFTSSAQSGTDKWDYKQEWGVQRNLARHINRPPAGQDIRATSSDPLSEITPGSPPTTDNKRK